MSVDIEPEWQPEIWHFDTGAASNIEPEIFWTVVQAASRQETLAIDYYSASSEKHSSGREVDPLGRRVRLAGAERSDAFAPLPDQATLLDPVDGEREVRAGVGRRRRRSRPAVAIDRRSAQDTHSRTGGQ